MSFMDRVLGRNRTSTAPPPAISAPRPDWMQRDVLKLPPWASVKPDADDKFGIDLVIDGDAAYREWLATLQTETQKQLAAWLATPPAERSAGPPEVLTTSADVDQYWLEVAYQCIKLDVDMALEGTQFSAAGSGKHVHRRITRASQYAQANYVDNHAINVPGKEMTGAERATQGHEAREHYKRIRGRLPV